MAFNVAANNGLARTGTLTVVSTTVTVTQVRDPATCRYTLNPGGASLGFTGGNVSMSVSTDSDCSWTAQSSAAWIYDHDSGGSGGSGNGSAGVQRRGQHRSRTDRDPDRRVNDCHHHAAPRSGHVPLHPQSWWCVGELHGRERLDERVHGQRLFVEYQSSVPWITITSGTSGSGNGTVTYTVAQNSGLSRNGGVTVGFSTATVAQVRNPATCRFAISPSGAAVGSGGGSGSINVSTDSDCSWVPTIVNSWIVITSGGAGATGPSSISWRVGSNTGPAKVGEIIVMGQAFTIEQAGS